MSTTTILSPGTPKSPSWANRAIPGHHTPLVCEWAREFRRHGLNPVPSRVDEKAPMVKHGWDAIGTELWDSLERKGRPCNVQVMTGRRWGLVVVDLDGDEAIRRWCQGRRLTRTWVSRSGSGNGMHLWFSVPRIGPPIASGPFWEGEGRHTEARLLGDKALVVAPPSIHPETGRAYAWLEGRNPIATPLAPCPGWVIEAVKAKVRPHRPEKPRRYFNSTPQEDGIDPLWLVQQWGLRIAKGPDARGWYTCHAYDREDRNPSARFHPENGSYYDFGSRVSLSLPGLGHAMGHLTAAGREGWDEIRERFARGHARHAKV